MAMRLSLPASYSWQPQTVPALSQCGLTQSLQEAILPINNKFVSIRRSGSTRLDPFVETVSGTTPDIGVSKYGMGRHFDGTSYASNSSAPFEIALSASHLKEFTMAAVVMPVDITLTNKYFFGYGKSTDGDAIAGLLQDTSSKVGYYFAPDAGFGNASYRTATSGLWANNTPAVVIGTHSVSANYARVYVSGSIIVDATANAGSDAVSFNQTALGNLKYGASANVQWTGTLFLAVSWKRALKHTEAMQFSANPWQIFDYPSRPILLNSTAVAASTAPPPYQRTLRFLPRKVA